MLADDLAGSEQAPVTRRHTPAAQVKPEQAALAPSGDLAPVARAALAALGRERMAELNIVEKVIALEGVEPLGTLSPEQLLRIASVTEEVVFPPGQVVITPVAPPEPLYVIFDGSVELSREQTPLIDRPHCALFVGLSRELDALGLPLIIGSAQLARLSSSAGTGPGAPASTRLRSVLDEAHTNLKGVQTRLLRAFL